MPQIRDAKVFGSEKVFLGSEVGLRLNTLELTASQVATLGVDYTDENGATFKVVMPGTVVPSNDANAKGICFEVCYPVEGKYLCSVLTAGKVYENRLPASVNANAKTALKFIEFAQAPGVVRPDFGHVNLTKLSAPTITSSSGNVVVGSAVAHASGYLVIREADGKLLANSTSTTISLANTGAVAGDKVYVIAVGDYSTYANSDKSNVVAYVAA